MQTLYTGYQGRMQLPLTGARKTMSVNTALAKHKQIS